MVAATVTVGAAPFAAQFRPRGLSRLGSSPCSSRRGVAANLRWPVQAAASKSDDGPAALVDAGTRALLEWARTKGLKTSKIGPATFGGLRGMVATEDVADGDIVAEVPYGAALEVVTSLRPCPFPEFVDTKFWDSAPYWAKMGLVLLREKSLGDQSQFASYLKQLPQKLDTPLEWTDAQLAQLQNDALAAKIRQQRDEWKGTWERAAAAAGPGVKITWGEFRWAADCARSRTFSGPYEGSDYSERINQAIFVSVLTAVFAVSGAGPLDKALSGALSVVAFLVLKDFFIRQLPNAPKRYVMCPVVDFCNHSSTVASDLAYEYFLNSFTLSTSATKKGEQLFISYGPQSNEDLLQFYGFIERGNINDKVPVDLLARMRETTGKALADGPAVLTRVEVTATGVPQEVVSATQALLGAATTSADARAAIAAALQAELRALKTTLEADEAELGAARRRAAKLRERDAALEMALEYRIEKKRVLAGAAGTLAAPPPLRVGEGNGSSSVAAATTTTTGGPAAGSRR